MKKLILLVTAVVATMVTFGQSYNTVSFTGYENYVGILKKQMNHVEDGKISINNDTMTIKAYGEETMFKINKTEGNMYHLSNGNKITIRKDSKSIRMDLKKKPEDEYYYYTYIFNIL